MRDVSLLELIEVLRAELGCRRPVEVRQADDLATAATIGWRRPVVLLPVDWTAWTPEQRRAVLAHEIAHAGSDDFLAILVGQLGLVLHFYHPLLHWLMNRLRLQQELAADAAAAGVSGGQRRYLTTIAELALRQQDRPLLWPARTFLPTRTTFLRRIAMLRDSKLRIHRLSPVARLTTIGAVLLCGLLVAGMRGPAEPPQAFAQAATTSAESAPANPKPGTQEAPATITGSWQAESLSMELKNGNHRTFGRQDGVVTAVITEKTFTLRLGENVLSEMEYVLDAKQTPWTIDMTSKEGVMLGICSRQGDDLKISLNDQAKGRPTDFDANRNGMVLVLLRHRYVQLSVINADGTGLHQVAAMPDFTRLGSPDWSRDGSKIAFDGWREFYGKDLDETHVFVINADGAGLKDLGMGCMPSWSPDDKQLTYCQYSEGRGVWVMNADGSGRRLIDGGGWGSQWSPVRNEIAYARNSDICIYDLGTGTSRTLLKKRLSPDLLGVRMVAGRQMDLLPGRSGRRRQGVGGRLDRRRRKGIQGARASSTPGIMTLQSTTSWGGTGNEVVISVQANDRTQRLYVLDFSSDKEPKLFPGIPADCWSIDPAWSLDGKRMAFCLRQPRRSNGSGFAPLTAQQAGR